METARGAYLYSCAWMKGIFGSDPRRQSFQPGLTAFTLIQCFQLLNRREGSILLCESDVRVQKPAIHGQAMW
jgi:hypothetical protein